ncbi:T9SS C-terminal target domain-containing protein [Hymenobacter lapidiphilus]|uniref:T9SS type A sorting domain-containing protein n=1 Tax=Hymenobacter sp. CCM 8763 TaxID=2303334 RepID=UPI000E340C0A|nr:T9SS type A sorting domain-containing protein [Hymenobacter sp. CCM 8763]RFP65952.1 T9SS C-terminal target domain-containing protein [Hymenobacter sp. CCM 8763]
MKKPLLLLLALSLVMQARAQFPSNSYAVRSECPGSANNPSTLEIINVDGSLTLIGIVREGTTPLVLNALGNDAQDPANLYALNVEQPITLANFNTPPNLYRVNLATAQAEKLGQVTPPPASPGGGGFGTIGYRQTLNFIGDGDNTSSYFVGGVSFNYNVFTGTITNFRFYVGQVQLNPFATAAPTWRLLDVSDPATTALIAQFALETQTYISGGFNGPAPEGGIQDWVFDPGSDNLVSYAGQDDKFITISGIRTSPKAFTTTPTMPIPATQDIGSMFTDRFGGVYAVNANDGTIFKINRLTGDWTGQTFGSALGCNRGDAVSFPDALPLPVTLTRFDAATAGPAVRLSWATAFEERASHFEVERSATATAWNTVARVAAGNQATGQKYAATDAGPLPGVAYYRLAMHDRDGTVSYSGIRMVRSAAATAVYPNPLRNTAQVLLPLPGQSATLELVSARGAVVRRLTAPAGLASVEVPMADLPAGIYLLRVQQAGATSTTRVVLEK